MLDAAITFLADEVNAHLRKRGVLVQPEDMVLPSMLVNDKGEWILPEQKIGLMLINIEEERVLREQLPERVYLDGAHVVLQPELRLNLTILFAARFAANTQGYRKALNFLSHVLTFFQSHPTFSTDSNPGLDSHIAKLNVELISPSPEQLNQTWAYLGSKYLPSAMYRVRMVTLQDIEPAATGTTVTTIVSEVNVR
ncbi:MAG: DUF4255 domain-containing protein [Gallionella sp.]|nr:DUF4255 domain-containing protein [Gallionella sp.]MDD4945785.1 DUF4255 domain-containing protein [Gallionella sp.]MDD5611777.1 DUF4255 domain-containing protein [Gallionella sp.]